MKVSFSRAFAYTPEWNGNKTLAEDEQVVFTLAPMATMDFYDLTEIIARLGVKTDAEGKADTSSVNADQQRKLVEQTRGHMDKYISYKSKPIVGSDGKDITIEDIGHMAYFLGLASELVWQLAGNAVPSELATKN